MTIEIYLGQVIGERRRYLGLNQEELSAKAGIHRAYLSDVERGLRNITIGVFERIAAALQIPMSELVRDAEQISLNVSQRESMGTRRESLHVLFEELTSQLSELVKHAEE